MNIQKDREDYFQWLKDTGKMKYELTDVFINKDGVLHNEKRMAWCGKTSPEDYREFCKETGREF
jgi:hypothetical protein